MHIASKFMLYMIVGLQNRQIKNERDNTVHIHVCSERRMSVVHGYLSYLTVLHYCP